MKFLILAENSNGTWPYLHYRSMGAFEINKRLSARNIESTVIEWFTHWTEEQLKECIDKWFADEPNPIIAISTPFSPNDVHSIKKLLLWAKKQYPNLKIINGGSRTYDISLSDIIDVYFLGRSMQMFELWIDGKDLTKYTKNKSPLVLVNDDLEYSVDVPVLPDLDALDFLTPTDILGFEVSVGCKFNCTFCNYELRNAGKTTMISPEELHNFFKKAYQKYGITNFYAADDTINETDEKLLIIAKAIEGLEFKPNIAGLARLDLISARASQQYELFEKIGFSSLFFGIESFNPEASKQVRKKSGLDSVYKTLEFFKEKCPNTFTVGGIIIGLNGDNEASIRSSLETVINENLLSSIQLFPLSITKSTTTADKGYHSQLDNDPEKFGYKTKEENSFFRNIKTVKNVDWTSDWTNQRGAEILVNNLTKEYTGRTLFLNYMEYAGLYCLDVTDNKKLIDNWEDIAYARSNKLKQEYIVKKYDWFQNSL